MRQNKFIAWDNVNKKMLFHFLISSTGETFIIHNPMLPEGDAMGMADLIPNRESVILLEFTGLLDKNGKEIYENYIVLTPEGWPKIVKWCENNQEGPGFTIDGQLPYKWETLEVIGNVFEHPEMVKE